MLGQAQQTVDQRRQIAQVRFQMLGDAMIQLFGMEQLGHPTQVRFDRKALIPGPALTILEIVLRRVFFAKAQVRERNRFAIIPNRQGPEGVVTLIGWQPSPIDHFARIVDQPSQFGNSLVL